MDQISFQNQSPWRVLKKCYLGNYVVDILSRNEGDLVAIGCFREVIGFEEPLSCPLRQPLQTWSSPASYESNQKPRWPIFSCPQQLIRWPCHWLTDSLTHFYFWHYRVTLETCDLWDICSEWWEYMTWPKKLTKTNTKTKTKTFWEHLLRAILETCDLWDIWSEWWEDMTWPKKLTKTNTLENILKEQS